MQLRHLIIPLLTILAQLLCAEVKVSTHFRPAQISKGQQATYVLTLTETSNDKQPELDLFNTLPIGPNIGGLEFKSGNWSRPTIQRIGFNNVFRYEASAELHIETVTSGIGEFTVPAYEIEYKGKTYTVQSAKLSVVETRKQPSADETVFLSLEAPKEMFIGQSQKIYANLYINERVSRVEYDETKLEGNAFSIDASEAEQTHSVVTIDGRRFQLLQWPMTVTAIQQGTEQRLSATSILSQVRVFTQQRHPIEADPVFIDVLPLPTKGQPESFSGAIGNFQMEVSTDLEATQTGEPIMLSLKLTGEGNFNRIQGPKLPDSNDWKIYAPESKIEDGSQGIHKRFDYVMIPKRVGTLKTPEIKFSFFDPENKEYIEYSSPPLEIAVQQGRQQLTAPAVTKSNKEDEDDSAANLSRALSPEEALLTLDYRPGAARQLSATNPFKSPAFILINIAGLVVVTLLSYQARTKRRLRTDPEFALQHACANELKTAATAAASAQDDEAFYINAQAAIRLALSKKTRRNLRNTELSELLTHLSSDSSKQTVTALFSAADAQRFSGRSTDADWKAHQAQLNSLLKAL